MEKYRINIPFKEGQAMENIFDLEDDLETRGITFDTGSDFKSRDWFLDWSLKGAKPEQVMDCLTRENIKFTKEEV